MNRLKEIVKYREMVFALVRRDLRGRYKGSVLGFLWTFLNPLFQLLVYTLVFSTIMRTGIENYYIFLFVALIPWLFFNTALLGGSTCILSNSDMIKKIYFPREVMPISNVTSGFVNMLLSYLVVFAVLIISGFGINIHALLYLPVVMIIEYVFTLGMVFLVAGITVFFRDLTYILNILVMAWQFLTPVMYSYEMIPEELWPVFDLNPMTAIIEAFRCILYSKSVPSIELLGKSAVIGILFLVVGYWLFGALQKRFAEEM